MYVLYYDLYIYMILCYVCVCDVLNDFIRCYPTNDVFVWFYCTYTAIEGTDN
jgi:hypothetical protein